MVCGTIKQKLDWSKITILAVFIDPTLCYDLENKKIL